MADVNNDGKLDAVVTNIGSASVAVIPGNGNGTLGAALVFSTNANPNQATVADVNCDGLLDLSTADAGPEVDSTTFVSSIGDSFPGAGELGVWRRLSLE